MKTLHLTKPEQIVFSMIPQTVKDGWEVQEEELEYVDTPQKQMMRLSLVRLHDPSLLNLREKALKAGTIGEVATMIHDMNLGLVDEDDLAELCFAIGPSMLSRLISVMMMKVHNDKDMEGVTALALIRHAILRSLQRVS